MPKKMGVNSRAVEAKAKKEETQKGKAAAAEKAQEDRAWKEAGDGAKSKAQAKKEEQVSRFPTSSNGRPCLHRVRFNAMDKIDTRAGNCPFIYVH